MTDREARFVGAIFLWLLLAGRDVLAAEQPLGTVFYSPQERAALVAGRHGGPDEDTAAEGKGRDQDAAGSQEEEVTAAPGSQPYAVSGIVSRSGGKSVVWLNGQPEAETRLGASLPAFRLANDHVVIDGKAVKVGETLDSISGARLSPLPAGAVKVMP